MKKQTTQTIIYSILFTLVFFSIIYLGLTLFSPNSLSKISSNLGNKNLAVYYAEKGYSKNQSQDKLKFLIEKCIIANKDEEIVEYGEIALNSKFDFSEEYLEEIATSVSLSLYNLEKVDQSISYAITYTKEFIIGQNPVSVLASSIINNKDNLSLDKLIMKLKDLNSEKATILAENLSNLK